MEVWAAFVSKARDKLDDIKKGVRAFADLSDVLNVNLPVFYDCGTDRNNVLLMPGACKCVTTHDVLAALPAIVVGDSPLIAVGFDELAAGGWGYVFIPPERYDRPLPILPDHDRGVMRCIRLKIRDAKDEVDWENVRETYSYVLGGAGSMCTPTHPPTHTPVSHSPTHQATQVPPSRIPKASHVPSVAPQSQPGAPLHQTHSSPAMSHESLGRKTSEHLKEHSEPEPIISENSTSPADLLMSEGEDEPPIGAQAAWRAAASGLEVNDALRQKLDQWAMTPDGQTKDIRVLLATLHTVVPPGVDLPSSTLGELMSNPSLLKRTYRKSLLLVHPDKVPVDNPRHKYIADRIFASLHKSYAASTK